MSIGNGKKQKDQPRVRSEADETNVLLAFQ